jgi:hypothetical protein
LEIEAFDQNGNNVALASEGATASQSSTYLWGGTTACPASIAIDGHTDDRGGITNNEQSPWIMIDLGTVESSFLASITLSNISSSLAAVSSNNSSKLLIVFSLL